MEHTVEIAQLKARVTTNTQWLTHLEARLETLEAAWVGKEDPAMACVEKPLETAEQWFDKHVLAKAQKNRGWVVKARIVEGVLKACQGHREMLLSMKQHMQYGPSLIAMEHELEHHDALVKDIVKSWGDPRQAKDNR